MIYALFMLLAIVSAWAVGRKISVQTALPRHQKFFIALVGLGVALVIAKLPFLIFSDNQLHNAGTWLVSGKTVLLGMVGGYIGVELAKWRIGVTTKTGDYFAVPVAVGIGVGRLGCFFGGCCFGVPCSMPWAVVFSTVDALPRHPTQIYESLFHLAMALVLYVCLTQQRFQGQLIKLYFINYFVFRFLMEFIRPEIHWTLGLTAYQWAILLLIPLFAGLWVFDHRKGSGLSIQND